MGIGARKEVYAFSVHLMYQNTSYEILKKIFFGVGFG